MMSPEHQEVVLHFYFIFFSFVTTFIGRDIRGKKGEMIGRIGIEEKIESDPHCQHEHCDRTRVIWFLQKNKTSYRIMEPAIKIVFTV